ncbi:hypothetical protein LRP67_16275 [Nocardioides sp. cx-169]|uniref:hypothetical protein n=1 Tax=Nocardioides sp. cx-169 TaxID=2899080 RepID=UPI001E54D162|nr:hypothetical protein [Nocardioides sp. cx-169]MCD4535650.1 hypothetical protein [Nocardioides sp. cx-169]
MATKPPRSARRNYALSALISRRAVTEARKVRAKGSAAVASVVAAHQIANAQTSQTAVAEMLAEQEIDSIAEALLNLASFTTAPDDLDRMVADIETDMEFDRLVASIVTDAARAAESVATAIRPNIYHVRFLSPPSCARCVILAGRVYRWSDGFQRHPGCDCSMIPTTVASPLVQDVDALVANGQVRGLSKADLQALRDGADLSQVVNVRGKKAGLLEAGHALTRGGRPTPAGIYRLAGDDRDEALRLLARYGFITP